MKRRSARARVTSNRHPTRRARRSATAGRLRDKRRAMLLVGTRKGAFFLNADAARRSFSIDGPHFLGHIIHHLVLDPRDGRTMLMASKTGHLGPTIFLSNDRGRSWAEAKRPPAFPKAPEGALVNGHRPLAVDFTFHLTPGHPSEPNVWFAQTCPPGLFRSDDAGMTWSPVSEWNDHPDYWKWNNPDAGTPDGAVLHWLTIDPRDPAHMYIVPMEGGVFETLNRGKSWRPLNKGVEANFVPGPPPEYGQDTHCLQMHPAMPDRLYQQSHCGIYRLDRPGEEWIRIGNNMPREVGDIGFPIVLHPRNPDTAWVFPMDGTMVWPRTSPDGKPAAYRTRDAGATWERQDRGFPREHGWFTVKRQAMSSDQCDPLGLYLGTTGGEIWASTNEGASWRQLVAHLPEIYSVFTAMVE